MSAVARILVGTDFSAESSRALGIAAGIARGLDAEIVLLHVHEPPDAAPLPAGAAERREQARVEMDRSRRSLESGEIRVRALLRPGDPATEILRVALSQSAGLIVIGTHGVSAAHPLLLGSVADRVVRYASLPVLVVPDPARRPDPRPGPAQPPPSAMS
jgi:nucleotide-binding universal stress UspA family protein